MEAVSATVVLEESVLALVESVLVLVESVVVLSVVTVVEVVPKITFAAACAISPARRIPS